MCERCRRPGHPHVLASYRTGEVTAVLCDEHYLEHVESIEAAARRLNDSELRRSA